MLTGRRQIVQQIFAVLRDDPDLARKFNKTAKDQRGLPSLFYAAYCTYDEAAQLLLHECFDVQISQFLKLPGLNFVVEAARCRNAPLFNAVERASDKTRNVFFVLLLSPVVVSGKTAYAMDYDPRLRDATLNAFKELCRSPQHQRLCEQFLGRRSVKQIFGSLRVLRSVNEE